MQMCHETCPVANASWPASTIKSPCCRKAGHKGKHQNKLWEWATDEYPGALRSKPVATVLSAEKEQL